MLKRHSKFLRLKLAALIFLIPVAAGAYDGKTTLKLMTESGFKLELGAGAEAILLPINQQFRLVIRISLSAEDVADKKTQGTTQIVEGDGKCNTYKNTRIFEQLDKTGEISVHFRNQPYGIQLCSLGVKLSQAQISDLISGTLSLREFQEVVGLSGQTLEIGLDQKLTPITYNLATASNRELLHAEAKRWISCWDLTNDEINASGSGILNPNSTHIDAVNHCLRVSRNFFKISKIVATSYYDAAKKASDSDTNTEAVHLLKIASDLGHDKAQNLLGLWHLEGQNGLAKDVQKASALFEKAMLQLNRTAFFNMGILLQRKDNPTDTEINLAYSHFKKAAALGFTSAYVKVLEGILEARYGEPVDYTLAHKYLKISMDQGKPLAVKYLRTILDKRLGDLSKAQSEDPNFVKPMLNILDDYKSADTEVNAWIDWVRFIYLKRGNKYQPEVYKIGEKSAEQFASLGTVDGYKLAAKVSEDLWKYDQRRVFYSKALELLEKEGEVSEVGSIDPIIIAAFDLELVSKATSLLLRYIDLGNCEAISISQSVLERRDVFETYFDIAKIEQKVKGLSGSNYRCDLQSRKESMEKRLLSEHNSAVLTDILKILRRNGPQFSD